MSKTLTHTAGAEDDGARLDKVLSAHITSMSRARLQAIIRAGGVTLQSVPVTDLNRRVVSGEAYTITVPDAEPAAIAPEAIPLTIRYEDRDLIVIDKPAGLTVHPGAGIASGTLVNALLAHCGESLSGIGGVLRPGIVHRLDKDTTGLMVAAKNDAAHRHLSAQFADHGRTGDLRREYVAFVWGALQPSAGTIDAPIGRHPASRIKMAVVKAGGRTAITHYKTEETYFSPQTYQPEKRGLRQNKGKTLASRVRCRLQTGRTHQVRVHLAYKGTPLIADPLYAVGQASRTRGLSNEIAMGIMEIKRQALHAATLAFCHPRTDKLMEFESELPEDMIKLSRVMETFM